MKYLLLACLGAFALGFTQTPVSHMGTKPVVSEELKNSYGVKHTVGPGRTTSPWFIFVDSIFVDTTGRGTYKKKGLLDTTKAFAVRDAYGFYTLSWDRGHRATASDDSGAFALKLDCYDLGAGNWLRPSDLDKTFTPGDSVFYDTLVVAKKDTAGGLKSDLYFPQCDSVRFILSATAATSNSDTINVRNIKVIVK